MTRRDLRAEVTLRFARSLEEPTSADQARVYAALRERIALEGGAGGSPVPAAQAPAAVVIAPTAASVSRASSFGARLSGLIVASLLSGGAGYWLGRGAEPARDATAQLGSPLPSVPPLRPPAPPERALGEARQATTASSLAPATLLVTKPSSSSLDPGPNTAHRAPPKGAEKLARRSTKERRARQGVSEPLDAFVVAPPDASFLETVRLLQRAQRSLKNGEAVYALSLLDEIEARVAAPPLGEERGALRVLALCANGDIGAARAVRATLNLRPDSLYARRVQESCAAR